MDDVELERVDLILAVTLEQELRRPHRTRVVGNHRGEQVTLDEHMRVIFMNADNGIRRAQILKREDMVDMPMREQDQPQRGLLLEQRVLDDQQVAARVDDGGRTALAMLKDVTVRIQPADHETGHNIVNHVRFPPSPPKRNTSGFHEAGVIFSVRQASKPVSNDPPISMRTKAE